MTHFVGHVGDLVFVIHCLFGDFQGRLLAICNLLLLGPCVEGFFERPFENLCDELCELG